MKVAAAPERVHTHAMSSSVSAPGWQAVIEAALARASRNQPVLKQNRSRQRSAEIIEAALRIFARDGISGARISDIAAEAGVPLASIYDYFAGKQELAYAIPIVHQTEFFAEFGAHARSFATCRERLSHFLWLTADYARRHPVWARVLYLEVWPSVLVKDSRVRHVLDDYSRILVGLLAEGAERGEWAARNAGLQTTTIFVGSISQLIITWLLYRKPKDLLAAAAPMIEQMLSLLDSPDPAQRNKRRSKTGNAPS